MTRSSLLALLALCASACSQTKTTPPSPEATAEGSLRPLTSRERGTDAAPPAPHPGATATEPGASGLPPGHPPLESGSTGLPLPPSHGMPSGGVPAFAGGTVRGTVALAPSVAPRLGPADVLYVIARDSSTRTVAAVKRIDKPTFPVSFELGAGDSMGGGTGAGGPFEIIARLSKSGDAIASAGDLEGQKDGVAFGATGVSITIDAVRK